MSGQLTDNDSYLLREQIANDQLHEHYERMNVIYDERIIMLIQRLGAKIYKDGNAWCCLYGDNIQEGICGFGDTPYQAGLAFYNEFYGIEQKGGEK